MKKTSLFVLATLLAGMALAAVRYQDRKVAWVPVAVPDIVKWQTTNRDGTVELWASRPHLLKLDLDGGYVWTTDDGVLLGSVVGGAVPTDMRKTLRRVR